MFRIFKLLVISLAAARGASREVRGGAEEPHGEEPHGSPAATGPAYLKHTLDRPTPPPDAQLQHFCRRGAVRGSCVRGAVCRRWGGAVAGHCFKGGVCCMVKPRCNDVTSAHSVLFQNPSFPKKDAGDSLCTLKLRTDRRTCAVRVEVDEFDLHIEETCTTDALSILGSDGVTSQEETPRLCGKWNQTTINFPVKKRSQVTFVFVTQKPHRFSMQITQLECASIARFISPTNAGLRNVDAQEYIPTTPKPVDAQELASEQRVNKNLTAEGSANTDLDVSGQYILNENLFPAIPNNLTHGASDFISNDSLIKPVRGTEATASWGLRDAAVAPWSTRIVGGSEARLHEYPWQAALLYERKLFCGGSLINDRIVLTAAHCLSSMLYGAHMSAVRVMLGDHDLRTRNETESKLFRVKRLYWNMHFSGKTITNDVALLELHEPVEFSYSIRPARLPFSDERQFESSNVTVSGWGRFDAVDRSTSPVLRDATAAVVPVRRCSQMYGGAISPTHHLCYEAGGEGMSCSGDSGGPVSVCSGPACTQIGVVSFGVGCANRVHPKVNARVSSYLPWLDMNLSPLSEEKLM